MKMNYKEWCIKNDKKYLIDEWDYDKNKEIYDLDITDVTQGSNRRAFWICSKDNRHRWDTKISHRSNGRGCPVCSGRKVIQGVNDLKSKFPKLIEEEWDFNKNINIDPAKITAKNKREVWWICRKGHSWKARIQNRTSLNTGCPKCKGSNGTSYPEQFFYFALKEKFNCVTNREKIGKYEYDIYVKDLNLLIEYDGIYWHRIKKDASNIEEEKEKYAKKKKFNFIRILENEYGDLAIKDNEITIDKNINDELLIEASKILFDYINSKFNINIDVNVSNEVRNNVLTLMLEEEKANSLAARYPKLEKQWNYEKNNPMFPFFVKPNSGYKVWWVCKKGHEWEATIASRVSGNNCPYCGSRKVLEGYNDLMTTHPELIKEWDFELNNKEKIKPFEVSFGSHKKVWWRCSKGHSWKVRINKRTSGSRCPYCHGRGKTVYKYDKDMKLIKYYKSISEAIRIEGFDLKYLLESNTASEDGYFYTHVYKSIENEGEQ